MSTLYSISSDTLTGLADAVRGLTGTSAPLSPDDMINGIEGHVCPSPTIQSLSVTQNGEYTAPSGVDGYSPVTVNVSGGGGAGGFTLIKTEDLGSINYTSTNAGDTGKSITVQDAYKYDILLVNIQRSELVNKYLYSTTTCVIIHSNGDSNPRNHSTKGMYATSASNRFIEKGGTNGTSSSRGTGQGLFPQNMSNLALTNGNLTMPIYGVYNSTNTGTINGNFTARVYGITLSDLIGGATS